MTFSIVIDGIPAYFLCKVAVELPIVFLQMLLGFVICYFLMDLQGNFIKRWNSIKEAEQHFNPNKKTQDNIGSCCRGNQKSAYKHIWKFITYYFIYKYIIIFLSKFK